MAEENEYLKLKDEYQKKQAALREELHAKIKALQDACPHEESTDWLMNYDFDARLCRRCFKETERRYDNLKDRFPKTLVKGE